MESLQTSRNNKKSNRRITMTLSYIYSKIFHKLHGKCVKGCDIHSTAVIGIGCNIINSTFGRGSYIGDYSIVQKTFIGQFCSISDHVYIGGAEHPLSWVSTSPAFENLDNSYPNIRYSQHDIPESKHTKIGNDVWIGHNVTIKAGVSIGDGVVVGAGAVVTKSIPAYAIVAGVPAKIVKYRFSDEIIKSLLETEWWNLSDIELRKVSENIKDPIAFIKKVKELKSSLKQSVAI